MVGVMECFRMAMYTYKAPSYHAFQFLHHIATAVTDSSCSAPYKHVYPEESLTNSVHASKHGMHL